MDVNVHEAKTHFSKLIERAINGEEIIIMKSNVPVVKLTPVSSRAHKRELGWARGEFEVPEDFDSPLPAEIEGSFYE